MRRRVETRLLSLDDALPLRVPDGVDVLLLMGNARSDEELPAFQARLQTYSGQGPVVVGLPRQSGPEPAYAWLHQGRTLRLTAANHRQLCAAVVQHLYPDAPPHWRADRATLRKAVDFLLDLAAPLWLPTELPARAERSRSPVYLLQQALVEPGLLQPGKINQNSALHEWRQGRQDRPEGRLFAGLLERIYRSGSRTLAEHLAWLSEPPRGLRGLRAWLYLVAALRCHSQDVRLAHKTETTPLARESLLRALRRPAAWRVEYRPAEPHEHAFTASVGRLFAGAAVADGALDLWEQARFAVLSWWLQLPGWTRQHLDGHSPNALALARLCESGQAVTAGSPRGGDTVGSARELIGRELPRAYRSAGIPRAEDQSFLLDRLESARLELEGHLQGQYDRMATRLYALFTGLSGDPATSRAWLDSGAREWLAGVPPRGAQDQELSPWMLGLRQAITDQHEVERRWFEELPARLELPPLSHWDSDLTVVFLARVARARLELELWTVLRTLPLDPRTEARQAQMGEWIRRTLQSVGLSAPRAEKILFDLLEQLYAQETPA